jgi:hypothetical protein
VVTDHRIEGFADDPPRLRIVGVGTPGFNAGITVTTGDATSEGVGRVLLTVTAHGSAGPKAGTLRFTPSVGEAQSRPITVSPGVALDLPQEWRWSRGDWEEGAVRIECADDLLPADDQVDLAARGGAPIAFFAPERPDLDAMLRALEAAGAARKPRKSESGDVHFHRPGGAGEFGFAKDSCWIQFPPNGSGAEVRGDSVVATGHPLARDVCVDPAVVLGRRGGPAPSGVPVLVDAGGPLICVGSGGDIEFGFVPGGTWVERDPSFVVLARNIVEFAAGGPARVEATGVLDPAETREAAEGETFGDLAAALAEAARPDPAARAPVAWVLLAAGAGLLAAAWWAER